MGEYLRNRWDPTASPEDVAKRFWKQICVKWKDSDHRARWQAARCPSDIETDAWKILRKQIEGSEVYYSEGITFVEILGLDAMYHDAEGSDHPLSGFAPKWDKSIWNLTNAICDMWDYDPTVS